MTIMAYKDREFGGKVGEYQAMINPDKITHERKNEYNTEQAPNSLEPAQKYKYSPETNLYFDLVLDCTGVVDAKRLDLPQELKKLQNLVYDYHGDIHRPYFLILRWGIVETFKCLLKSSNTTYTLFDPDGTPLRAKVTLRFDSYLDPKSEAIEASRQSPDLTHRISVVAGDSLPVLSQRVYDKPDYYVQLAEFNGLNKFRHIRPGSQLVVPPLVPANSTMGQSPEETPS
jgi:LysM repeat protein